MKKNKTKLLVILGAICILLVAVSSWYTITFNEARFIVPMDISTYTFRLKDLPMIISGILITFYVLYLVVLLIQVIAVNKRKGNNATITRNLNPKLGFLGFLGFFGFLGFWTHLTPRFMTRSFRQRTRMHLKHPNSLPRKRESLQEFPPVQLSMLQSSLQNARRTTVK